MLSLNESLVEDLAVGLNTEGFGLDSSKRIIAPKVSKELCSSNHHFGDNITYIGFSEYAHALGFSKPIRDFTILYSTSWISFIHAYPCSVPSFFHKKNPSDHFTIRI